MTGFVPTWEDLRRFVQSLLARRWVRFGLMGGLATLCYALLGLLFVNVWALPLLVGNGLAYLISFFVSYLGQSLWTFQARGGHRAMLPRFAATQAVGLGLNSCIVWLLVRLGLALRVCHARGRGAGSGLCLSALQILGLPPGAGAGRT